MFGIASRSFSMAMMFAMMFPKPNVIPNGLMCSGLQSI